MKVFIERNKTVFLMGLVALVIAGTADLFAGLTLSSMEEYLLLIPGMMIMIYPAIGMRGTIFGAMGRRLGTAMHMGTFRMNFRRGGVLRANIESAVCLTMVLSIATGAVTWVVAKMMFSSVYSIWDFIFISTLGGVLSGLMVMLFNIIIVKEGYKRDWDVDNITSPIIAAIGDIVTVPMIFLAAWFFLSVAKFSFGEPLITALALAFILLAALNIIRLATREVNKRDFSGEAKRIVKSSLPLLMVCLVFEIVAGIIIQREEAKLFVYAVLLIMLPAFLNEGNALSGMLTSRFSSMIHLGTMEPSIVPQKAATENFGIMYMFALITFPYICVITYIAAFLVGGGTVALSFWSTFAILMVAGLILTTLLNLLSYYVAILATKFGLDPDDHCIPITSSVMDLFGALVFVGVVYLFI